MAHNDDIIQEKDNLNFPDAPDFISKPPSYTMQEMIILCEKMLPYWNKKRFQEEPPKFIGEPFVI